jgi:hypothetical protein
VWVESGRRLVGEDDFRICDEGAGDRNTLLLAAGEPGGQMAQLFGDSHPIGESSDGFFFNALTVQPQRERDVLRDGQGRHQVEALEDEPHPPPPEDGEAAAALAGEIRPAQADCT